MHYLNTQNYLTKNRFQVEVTIIVFMVMVRSKVKMLCMVGQVSDVGLVRPSSNSYNL